MKQNLYIYLSGAIILIAGAHAHAMENIVGGIGGGPVGGAAANAVNAVGGAVAGVARDLNQIWQEIAADNARKAAAAQRADEAELRELDAFCERFPNSPVALQKAQQAGEIRDRIGKRRAAQAKTEERGEQVAAKFLDVAAEGTRMTMEVWKNEQLGKTKLDLAAIEADANAESSFRAAQDKTKQYLDFFGSTLRDRKLAAGAVGATLTVVGGYHAIKLGAEAVRRNWEIPELASEENTSLISARKKLWNWLTGNKPEPAQISDAIFAPSLAKKIRDFATSLQFTVQNGGYLTNVLLWGPPGTGKTMIAKLIARSCGMEYIYFPGTKLLEMDLKHALNQLDHLFEFAKKSKKRLVLVIDECEGILGKRTNKDMPENAKKICQHIITHTGTETRNFMCFFLSNLPEDLDEAVLSRCGYKLQVGLPAYEQLLEILKKYVNKYLIECSDMKPVSSFWARLFGTTEELKKVNVAPGALDDAALSTLARTLVHHQFAGRDIEIMTRRIRTTAFATEDFTVTPQVVYEAVSAAIEEKAKEAEKFKRDNPARAS